MKLKILSWNIWIDNKFDQVTAFLKNADADIIGLQEVKANDPTRDVIKFLEELGYHSVFAPLKLVWDGVEQIQGPALFSRFKIAESGEFLLSEEEPRKAAWAKIEARGKTLNVFSTHLIHTHQTDTARQAEQIDNLIKLLPQEKVVVMGDFNAAPESYAVKKMEETLVNTDPSNAPTWSVYLEGCDVCNKDVVDTRLDYIFVRGDIKFSNPQVGDSKGSDHLPISVEIEI